jgi:hypothetical protein
MSDLVDFTELDEVAADIVTGDDLSEAEALAIVAQLMPGEGWQVRHNLAAALVRSASPQVRGAN